MSDSCPPARFEVRTLLIGVAIAISVGLSACTSSNPSRGGLLPTYRSDLPQGNYITRGMVEQVRPGMQREQVRAILGTPLLGHVFHSERWDYTFRFRHADGRTEQRNVTVRFRNGVVSEVTADPLPEREDPSDPALPGFKPPR
jgi:outer membrane protein assembly factor BamE